ncbi:MAG: hypothetical protein ACK59G_04200 [Cyanobacteriota bacterium]
MFSSRFRPAILSPFHTAADGKQNKGPVIIDQQTGEMILIQASMDQRQNQGKTPIKKALRKEGKIR